MEFPQTIDIPWSKDSASAMEIPAQYSIAYMHSHVYAMKCKGLGKDAIHISYSKIYNPVYILGQ